MALLASLAILPDWFVIWITPICIVGVGVLLGLFALLVLWGIGALISGIPVVGRIAEDARLRQVALPVLSAAAYALLVVVIVLPRVGSWFEQDSAKALESIAIAQLAFIPLSVVLAMTVITIASKRAVDEALLAVREGVLSYITTVLAILAMLGLATPLIVKEPGELFSSLRRLPYTGTIEFTRVLPAAKPGSESPEVAVETALEGDEVRTMIFHSGEAVELSAAPGGQLKYSDFVMEIPRGKDVYWRRGGPTSPRLPDGEIAKIYLRNLGQRETEISVSITTAPQNPEVSTIPIAALSVFILYLCYMVQRSWMPRLSAVSLATAKSEIAQPLFAILVGVGSFFLLTSVFMPFNTFGEDIKMLKETGLTVIMVLCIFQAIWAAGTSVSEEIEGRTALTVLSKPINRIQFILGKFLGIVWTVSVMFTILGTLFLFAVTYKMVYDGNERSVEGVTWQLCHYEMARIVPGMALAFMETVVLAAISVAISTRLSMLANFTISLGVYVLGHLTPLIVQSSLADYQPVSHVPVAFVGQLIAAVIPVLDHFNIQAAVAGGSDVPLEYLGWAMLYCLMYVTLAMLLALVLFEDRDMA